MAKYEVLRVDLAVDGAQEQAGVLEELLARLRVQMSGTASAIIKAIGSMSTNAGKSMDSFYKQVADGRYTKLAAGALKRTVSGFDELNRLVKKTSGGTSVKQNQQLLQSASDLVDRVGQLGSEVKDKVMTPLGQWATGELAQRLGSVGQKLAEIFTGTQQSAWGVNAYSDAWERLNLKTTFWCDQVAHSTQITAAFNAAMANSGLAAGKTGLEIDKLNLKVSNGSGSWLGLGSAAQNTWNHISTLWGGTDAWFSRSVTTPVDSAFSGLLQRMEQEADRSWASTKTVFSDAGGYFSGVFSDAWGKVVDAFSQDGQVFVNVEDGVLSGFRRMVNDLIDGINEVTVIPFGGLNSVLDKLQGIRIGNLKPFSFLNWRASVPQIPHLARGAVLPANRPFLAMVGDQRHGTNIEAPLATIQEAVAITMEDLSRANMAGHEATVALLGQILEAVLGIQIGDDTIAAACNRYNHKINIITGR